jgi:hypothetical protein
MSDPATDLNRKPNLGDPTVLVEQCQNIGRGLAREAECARSSGAMQGHPYPAFFFEEASKVILAASALIQKLTVKPAVENKPKTDDKPK